MSKRDKRGSFSDEELDDILDELGDEFDALAEESELTEIYQETEKGTHQLQELPRQLAKLRRRGYVHSGELEAQLSSMDEQWQELIPSVEDAIANYQDSLEGTLDDADKLWKRVDKKGKTRDIEALDGLLVDWGDEIDNAKEDLRGMYNGLTNQLDTIEDQLNHVGWMLTQLDESEIKLQSGEGPVMAVEAEWQKNGEEGPDGILYLTDQRLLFEQKESVATKKFLGIFTTESEHHHNLLLTVPVPDIEDIKNSEEGGFLGIGKADILEFVFAASASVSRARFHLKGQDSSDWAVLLKQVQTGSVHRDRSEEYADEVEHIKNIKFPTQCPNCFAAVPKPAIGVTSVTCEFCNTTIEPIAA